jgi:hypothetical protein
MKKITVLLSIFFVSFNCIPLISQNIFFDDFELGNLNKWDTIVGAQISTDITHSGNYSVKFKLANANEIQKKIVKNNPIAYYDSVDFYMYIKDLGWYTGVYAGKTGWLWRCNFYYDNLVYVWNCAGGSDNGHSAVFPIETWNHIQITRTINGYLKLWINGNIIVASEYVQACSYTSNTLGTARFNSGSDTITAYLDDIYFFYSSLTETNPISYTIPVEISLYQNYPNPFNPVTEIKFDIPKPGQVILKVYDIAGREVWSFNDFKKAGSYSVTFDGTNLASGIYFYRLEADAFAESKKMVLIK